jgi:hypothetical protein
MAEEQGYLLVTMVGKIIESTLNYTKNGSPYTKGRIAIPFTTRDDELKHKFYNFIVWSDLAEIVAEIPEDTLVKMEGDLRISSYDKACADCGTMTKKYWTDIVINNVDLV